MSRQFFIADTHFGHVHGNPEYNDYSKQHFCVSCERIDYTPIEMKEIVNRITKI